MIAALCSKTPRFWWLDFFKFKKLWGMVSLVLHGLIKRRVELTGEIEDTSAKLRQMIIDLEALDATIQ